MRWPGAHGEVEFVCRCSVSGVVGGESLLSDPAAPRSQSSGSTTVSVF